MSFLFTVVGRWLQVYIAIPWEVVEESRTLEEDPLVKELQQSVVSLNVRGAGGVVSHGTGFNLDPQGLIVTNRHVVEEAMFLQVNFPGEGKYRVTDWVKSKEDDLALLKLEGEKNLPHVELAERRAEPGQEILVIGNPLRLHRIAMQGKVLEASPSQIVVGDASIHQGHSGSPVFNREGEVLGVIYASRYNRDQDNLGVAVSLPKLEDFLQQEKEAR